MVAFVISFHVDYVGWQGDLNVAIYSLPNVGDRLWQVVGCSIFWWCLGRKMFWIHVCGHRAGCSVEYSEWMVWCRWQLECWLVGVWFCIAWWFWSAGGVVVVYVGLGAGAWLWRWHVYCSCAWCVWLSGVVLFQVCGMVEAVCGSQMMLAYSKMGRTSVV